MRLALFISKSLRRCRGFGWPVVTYQSPNSSGWSPCRESSLTPGPSGTGGESRMPVISSPLWGVSDVAMSVAATALS
jgi:hypothetical protein